MINYPSINNPDYQELITQKEKEIEILNNIYSVMNENSYIGWTNSIRYIEPYTSLIRKKQKYLYNILFKKFA